MAQKPKTRFGIRGIEACFNERGVTAIEYALLLPVLFAFVLGIIDAGRIIWTQVTLDHAAETAARCGAVDTVKCGSASAIQTYAADQAAGLVLLPSAFVVVSAACGSQVSAALPVTLTLPWNGSNSLTLHAKACYPL
jgi:Flp pilus assembly protein TadG